MQIMHKGAALMPVDLAQLQGGIPIVLDIITIAGTLANSGNTAIPGKMCHRNHGSKLADFAETITGTINVGMLCMLALSI